MNLVYQITYQPHVQRLFKKMDKSTQVEILSELERLAQDPLHHPHIKRLAGISEPGFRLRVGRWRVLYLLFHTNQIIEVIDIFMKKSGTDYRRRLRRL